MHTAALPFAERAIGDDLQRRPATVAVRHRADATDAGECDSSRRAP